MDATNLTAVTTGDAGKVNHAKPRARVDDKNVQNVDFLDIVNRLSASQTQSGKVGKTAKQTAAQETFGAQEVSGEVESTKPDSEVLGTLDEIISEYGAENLNAGILMDLMAMYTTDSSVNTLVTSDTPLQTVQSSLYSAVLDNTPILTTGGEMIDEIAEGYFDDLINVMSSSKAVSSLLEVLGSVQDADEFERALQTISSITVTSEVNEVDRTVNALSEQLNLSKAVRTAKASIESGEMPVQSDSQIKEVPILNERVMTQTSSPAQNLQPVQTAQTPQPTPAVQTAQPTPAAVQNTRTAQTAEPTQIMQTAQPMQAAETGQAEQTVQPELTADIPQAAQPIQTADPAQVLQTAAPEQAVQTVQPQTAEIPQTAQPTQTAEPAQVMQTAAPEQAVQTAQTQTAQTPQTAQPIQTAEPAQVLQTAAPEQAVQTVQPQTADIPQTAQPAQVIQPVTTEGRAPAQTADTEQKIPAQPTARTPERAQPARSTQQTQTANTPDTPADTAAQAMGFVDYGRGVAPKEVLTEGTPEDKAVFNQTLDLLSRAITEERQLYTARLHPEGLGEIIIRMEKSSAGVVFDILATNEKTAQLINAKLAQLQNGMTEYDAKINPAVVTASSNAESMSGFGFDDFTGGFGGGRENAYSGNRQRAGTRYTEAGEDEREAKTTGYKTTDILNRTI